MPFFISLQHFSLYTYNRPLLPLSHRGLLSTEKVQKRKQRKSEKNSSKKCAEHEEKVKQKNEEGVKKMTDQKEREDR